MKRIFSIILFGLVAVSMMAANYSYYAGPTAVTVEKNDVKKYTVKITQIARDINKTGGSSVTSSATLTIVLQPLNDKLEGVYTSKGTGVNKINGASVSGFSTNSLNTGKESTITIAKYDQETYYVVSGSIYLSSMSNVDHYQYDFCYDKDELTKPVAEIGKKPFKFTTTFTTGSKYNYDIFNITDMKVTDNTVSFDCQGNRVEKVSGDKSPYSYSVHLVFPSSDINGEYSTISQDPSRRLQNTSYVEWDGTKRYLTYEYVSNLTVVQNGEGDVTIVKGTIQGLGGSSDGVSPRRYHFAEAIVVDENKNGNDVLLRNCIRLDKTLDNVQLLRSLSKDYYNTFCSPIRLTAGQISDAFGEGTDIRALENTSYNEEKNEITLNFSTSSLSTIEAGVPYLIKPGKNVENPVFTNVAISDIATEAKKVETDAVWFHGILSPYTLEADDDKFLFLAANNTLKFGKSGKLKGMRAYLYIKDNVPAQKLSSARARIQMGQDVTTSVLNTTDCSNAKKVLRDGQIVILRDGKAYNVMGTVCE